MIMGLQRAWIWSVLLVAILLGLGFPVPAAYAAKGDKEYKAALKAEDQKDYDTALRLLEQAVKLNPSNPQFSLAAGRVRFQASAAHVTKGHQLLDQGKLAEALAEFQQAAAQDPSNDLARQEIRRTTGLLEQQKAPPPSKGQELSGEEKRVDEALGPPQLKPLSQAAINLRMTNEARVVFETIGKLAGVNVLFDPDFATSPAYHTRITVELNNVSLEDALDQTALVTKTFWKALTPNTILVIQDTAVKRREQEEQVIKTFYLSNPITPQELTEAVTAIRSLLETRRIQQINSLNAIIIRDTPDKVAIAGKIIQDIDKAKAEVVVDVAVLEARRDKSRQLGLYPVSGSTTGILLDSNFTPPGTTTTTPTTGGTTGTTTTTTTTPTAGSIGLNQLGRLSTSDWSVTLPGANLNALLSDSKTRILQRPEVRASNGQKASLKIGDRVPIATGSYQPGVAGVAVSSLVSTQFQYLDVGVNLDITPSVHANNEITLKVRIEVSQVTGTSNIGGISQPIIGQRIIDHEIRLHEGEVNVLGGLLQTQVTKSVAGVPGLSQIPLLKYLFSNVSDTLSEDEVLLVLTPHTVRLPDILAINRKTLDVGTEGDVHLRSISKDSENSAAPAAGSASSDGASPARLRFENANLEQKTGETFQVPLQIENARDAFSASLDVSYDAGFMKLVKVTNGGFLGQDGQPVAVVQRADEQSGKTSVTLTRPPASVGIAGSGTLAVLTFEADHAGKASLGISSVTISSPSQKSLPAEGSQATVTIH
jgi:general secretion pathway protein D